MRRIGASAIIPPMCAFIVFGAVSLSTCQDTNLVANPGFEDGILGWEIVNPVGEAAQVALTAEHAVAGDKCLHVASTVARGLRPVGVRQAISLDGPGEFRLSVWARNTELSGSGGVRVTALDKDAKRLLQNWPVRLYTWESHWQRKVRTIRLPATTARIELLLSVNGAGEAWFDDISLTRLQAAPNPAGRQVPQIPTGISVTRYPTHAPVMNVEAADIDSDGCGELLCGDIDGVLSLRRRGETLWRFDMGGLPCDIACGDMNGDGRQEVAVATMNENADVFVLSPNGEQMWRKPFDDGRCARVCWADIEADAHCKLLVGSANILTAFDSEFQQLWQLDVGGPRLVALTAGDLDGDGRDEIIAGYRAQTLRAIALDGDGRILWRYDPPDWPGSCSISSLFVTDADGDGNPDVVGAGSSGAAFVLDAGGQQQWRAIDTQWPRETYLAEPVRYTDEHLGTQIVLFGRRSLAMRAGAGPEIFESQSGLKIIDCDAGASEPDTVYLASSGVRDPAVYRLRFSEGHNNGLVSYNLPDPIAEQLDRMYQQVTGRPQCNRPPSAADRKFHILLYRNNRSQVKAAWQNLASRSNQNVEYEILTYVKELPVELHRFPMSDHDDIIDYARFFEEKRIPFWLFVDHGCRPWITVETAQQIIGAAQDTCRGFYLAEDTSHYAKPIFYEWLDWAGRLLEVCHNAGKRVIFKQMFDCWSLVASDRDVYDVLFKYPETIIPMFATNNVHAPEIQIGGMLGLWRAGACHDWGMSSQDWNWNWTEKCCTRVDTRTICPPDVIFRMDAAAAALGCTYFHVEGGQEWLSRDGQVRASAKRHRELLYQMMDRNMLLPPAPNRLVGLSPIAIARTTDPDQAKGAQIGRPGGRKRTPFRTGLLGVKASMQTPPEEYLPSYAYGVRHYFDGFFPATPYGYLQFLPAFLARERADVAQAFIHTSTSGARIEGKQLSATHAKPVILSQLRRRAKNLPFRTDDAFLSAQKWGDQYRIILLDSPYLNPGGVEATVRVNTPDRVAAVKDLITAQSIDHAVGSFTVQIPPGGARLLSATVR